MAKGVKNITEGKDPTNGRFIKGNQVAVKWTEETITAELDKIWDVLSQDDSGDQSNNPIRANDIKYAEEAVMCAGVNLASWEYWNSVRMVDVIPKDSSVFMFIKKIKKVCELRLSYSGQVMDIFHIKNHFGYTDKKEVENTIKGGGVSFFTVEE